VRCATLPDKKSSGSARDEPKPVGRLTGGNSTVGASHVSANADLWARTCGQWSFTHHRRPVVCNAPDDMRWLDLLRFLPRALTWASICRHFRATDSPPTGPLVQILQVILLYT